MSLNGYTVPMGRTPTPPLGRFSRQLIGHTLDLIAAANRDASGRWLASQIEMSPTYVAKRLRYELPFTTTDVERIARTFGMTSQEFVNAAVATPSNVTPIRTRDDAVEERGVARSAETEPMEEQ